MSTGYGGQPPSNGWFRGTMEWTPKFRKTKFHFYLYVFNRYLLNLTLFAFSISDIKYSSSFIECCIRLLKSVYNDQKIIRAVLCTLHVPLANLRQGVTFHLLVMDIL